MTDEAHLHTRAVLRRLGPEPEHNPARPMKGKVTMFYDGKVWTGNPGDIPLTSEIQIQLDIGKPLIAPEHIVFPAGLAPACENAAGIPAKC